MTLLIYIMLVKIYCETVGSNAELVSFFGIRFYYVCRALCS